MPSIQLPLISYEELISEPIRKQIGARIGGDINYVNSAGNKLTNSDSISLSNANEARVLIVEDDWQDGGLSSNLTNKNNRPIIIADQSIGLSVQIADMEKEFTISINKRFATRADAIWWRNSVLGNLRDGTSNTTTAISMAPCIPNTIVTLIEKCRELKHRRGCEDRSFMEYLLGISADNIDMDTNSTSSNVAITFPETLDGLVFSLPNTMPTPSLEDGKYVLDIEIKTIIRVPVGLTLTYPNFIGDSLLPENMIDMSIDVNMDRSFSSNIGPIESLLSFRGAAPAHYRGYCYQIPAFENYRMPMSKWNLSPIFQIRVSADKDDSKLIVNINDLFQGSLSGYELDKSILDYIVKFRDDASNPNTSLISVVLMKGMDMVTPSLLHIDEFLNFRSKYDLDPIGDYHLVIATALQTAAIPTHIFDTAKDYPVLLKKLIKHTNPTVEYNNIPEPTEVSRGSHAAIFNEILNLPNVTSALTANTLVVNSKLM